MFVIFVIADCSVVMTAVPPESVVPALMSVELLS